MAYPTLAPSARSYTPGDWAQKRYQAMSGAEVRIRYGDKRTDARLTLQYQNLTNANAALFLADYDTQLGTYKAFTVPAEVLAGWEENNYVPNTSAMKFRYAGPPQLQAVSPGITSVSVELVGVI